MGVLKEFIWPIERKELKKFLPMSLMLFFTLYNYNALRSLKDSLVVPNIGAEAISFVKFFCVVPAAIIFVLIYAKMTNVWNFRKIYFYIAGFFIGFFLLFGFVLYPYEAAIHPNSLYIESLINQSLDLQFCQIHLSHFKWFFLVYNKWLYAIFYMFSELWTVMNSLLFWQFANQVIKTKEAKRFYPMFAFIGSFGTFTAGGVIKLCAILQNQYGEDTMFLVQMMMSTLVLSTIAIISLFEYVNRNVITDRKYINQINAKVPNKKMPLLESLKIITSSRYLGYIAILVLCYGISVNLLEGPWKATVRELYPSTDDYVHFMAGVNQWTGGVSMIFILVGASILKRYSWFTSAIITPITFFVTGIAFFIFIVFDKVATAYLGGFMIFDPLTIAVYLGMAQNVLSKSTKYALFDPTKEMTYIPIDDELKSKGKAAVDVVAARFAKSGAAFLQSVLFIIFPAATYLTISTLLMTIFVVVVVVWIIDVKLLNKVYSKQLTS
jgi:AAA family ATP:ADP antiporter